MFKAGAHYGYGRSRRHPSAEKFLFGTKNRVELFDLEKTNVQVEASLDFVKKIASEGGQILFVSSKLEAVNVIETEAKRSGCPYVAGRWIGGTLTNFSEIRKRIDYMEDLENKREKGEWAKYTKKERLLMDREVKKLRQMFEGLVSLKSMPKAMFIVDVGKEKTAVGESKSKNIPVVSLSCTDCNFNDIDYPIPANDSSLSSISYFVKKVADSYLEGKMEHSKSVQKSADSSTLATPVVK